LAEPTSREESGTMSVRPKECHECLTLIGATLLQTSFPYVMVNSEKGKNYLHFLLFIFKTYAFKAKKKGFAGYFLVLQRFKRRCYET